MTKNIRHNAFYVKIMNKKNIEIKLLKSATRLFCLFFLSFTIIHDDIFLNFFVALLHPEPVSDVNEKRDKSVGTIFKIQ